MIKNFEKEKSEGHEEKKYSREQLRKMIENLTDGVILEVTPEDCCERK